MMGSNVRKEYAPRFDIRQIVEHLSAKTEKLQEGASNAQNP